MNNELKGVIYTFIGGTLWGISGIFGAYLFINKATNANWLVPYRLIVSGLLLLLYLYKKDGNKIFNIFKTNKDFIQIMSFGILGMLSCQYTYYKTIEYSNPAIATVLQYLGPTLILIYVCILEKRKPKKFETIALIFSIIGVFLLATNGNIKTLKIPIIALIWGLISAVALVIYTVQPIHLMKKYGTSYVVAWGMFIGGIFLSFFTKPWNEYVIIDFTTILFFFIIVIFGTIISFLLYLTGVATIGATKASMIACIEPVSATFFSAIFLGTKFTLIDGIGIILILSTVFIIAYFSKSKI